MPGGSQKRRMSNIPIQPSFGKDEVFRGGIPTIGVPQTVINHKPDEEEMEIFTSN